MVDTKMNISEIETHLHNLFKGVSQHTYAGTLPSTIGNDWEDMVLISCDNGVTDYDAYGKGIALLFLYARPRSNGTKNVTKMKALENAVDQIIENQGHSGNYYFYRQRTYSDYDFSRNWHFNVVSLGLIVK